MFRFRSFFRATVPRVAVASVAASTVIYSVSNKNDVINGILNKAAWCEPATFTEAAAITKPSIRSHLSSSSSPSQFAPNPEDYEPIDETMYIKDFNVSLSNHVLYSCLLDDRRIKRYEVYKHRHNEEILCVVDFGEAVVGWPEIVHGGISALLIDNTFGWLLFAFNKPMSVTANLHLDYRSPVRSNTTSILRVKIDHAEGRKLHMTGSLTEASTGRVQVEAKSLFIIATKKTKQEGY